MLSLGTWYLFWEAAAGKILALPIAKKKPKEEVETVVSKLMENNCEWQGLSERQIRFRFDGHALKEADTPAQMEMEEEDTTDVFQQQTGSVY